MIEANYYETPWTPGYYYGYAVDDRFPEREVNASAESPDSLRAYLSQSWNRQTGETTTANDVELALVDPDPLET